MWPGMITTLVLCDVWTKQCKMCKMRLVAPSELLSENAPSLHSCISGLGKNICHCWLLCTKQTLTESEKLPILYFLPLTGILQVNLHLILKDFKTSFLLSGCHVSLPVCRLLPGVGWCGRPLMRYNCSEVTRAAFFKWLPVGLHSLGV